MEKNIMFINEEINTVYENISVLIENAGICYMEGNEEEAQRYKGALNQVYREIGAAVLENKEIAKEVQRLLKGYDKNEEAPFIEDHTSNEDTTHQVLCAKIVHEEACDEDAEWYIVDSKDVPRNGECVQLNCFECGYVLETKYINKDETLPFWTISGDNEKGWGVTTKPAGVLCARVESNIYKYDDEHREYEWYKIDGAKKPQVHDRVDITCYDKGIIDATTYLPEEETKEMDVLRYNNKYNAWNIIVEYKAQKEIFPF